MSLLKNLRAPLLIGGLALAVLAAGRAIAAATSNREELRAHALKNEGALARGRELFGELSCASCHGSSGQGRKNGPALTGIAARHDRAEIVRSVLEPSQRIALGWQRIRIATHDGRVLVGRLQNAIDDDQLEIITATGQRLRVSKGNVESHQLIAQSSMPDGLVEGLSKEDFAALVSYVASLE